MVEWRKGLGTGRCGMNVPHVDYTERRTPARGAVRKPPVRGLSSSSEEGGGETTWGPQSFIKVWSCLESVVQVTASRTTGKNDSYDW